MIEIQRILCPVDFSDYSRHALDHAVAIARWYDSSITLLHVQPIEPIYTFSPGGPLMPPTMLTREQEAALLASLREFAEEEIGSIPVSFEVAEGNPASTILERTCSRSTDLVVMGTHGRSGFERFILGSVTEKVLRRAACPVLSVPPRIPDAAPVPQALFRRILCPIDFSGSSIHALNYAVSLAKEADAHLTVLNVLEIPAETLEDAKGFGRSLPPVMREYVKTAEEEAHRRLEEAIPASELVYFTVDTKVSAGRPYREILRIAAADHSNLIVMGVRGRGTRDLLTFGSTTQHVVREAECPVLTLRG
ncbi:MAG TPA: universal stress protein [Vicinamibacterales bacterium]|nr:universal stress protein [Vicinamibacterales bacterium]